MAQPHPVSKWFGDVANAVARQAGRPVAFVLAVSCILVWGLTGPLFGYSDTWQLIINTGTTIVTFLMVFLIQNSQNRDNAAIQVKLDELIRTSQAHNTFVGIEHLTDEELEELRDKCEKRAAAAHEELEARPDDEEPEQPRARSRNGGSAGVARAGAPKPARKPRKASRESRARH
jgi:low affinity Fe/Cu permease